MDAPARPDCLVCAWRENCQKRWRISRAEMLGCLDYSFDRRLGARGGEGPAEGAGGRQGEPKEGEGPAGS